MICQLFLRLHHLPVNRHRLATRLLERAKLDVQDPLVFLEEQVQQEHRHEAQIETVVSSLILSLKEVGEIDWEESFRKVSHLEIQLTQDPSDVYRKMDSTTRGRYRNVVTGLAKKHILMKMLLPTWLLRWLDLAVFSQISRCLIMSVPI